MNIRNHSGGRITLCEKIYSPFLKFYKEIWLYTFIEYK